MRYNFLYPLCLSLSRSIIINCIDHRYSNSKLQSAQNITQQDVTHWQAVERLFKRKEAEAKSLQQETERQRIEVAAAPQEAEQERQETERQRLEAER